MLQILIIAILSTRGASRGSSNPIISPFTPPPPRPSTKQEGEKRPPYVFRFGVPFPLPEPVNRFLGVGAPLAPLAPSFLPEFQYHSIWAARTKFRNAPPMKPYRISGSSTSARVVKTRAREPKR